jgi:hypothetical protein
LKTINRQIINFTAISLFISCNMACTQIARASLIIDVSLSGIEVAPICRVQELEEFYHGIEGGPYAQIINNPSFEEASDWYGTSDPTKYCGVVVAGSSADTRLGQSSNNTGLINSHQVHCVKMTVTSVASGSVGLKNDDY